MKIFNFLFWNLIYLFRPKPKTLDDWYKKADRTYNHWRKFKPYLWHNDLGNQWHITFEKDPDHTRMMNLRVCAHISNETGNIVGLTVYDEVLRNKDEN